VLADYLRESREKHERDSIRQRRIIDRAFVKPAAEELKDAPTEYALRLVAAGVLLEQHRQGSAEHGPAHKVWRGPERARRATNAMAAF
jgi:hypothetical protein